MKSREEIILEIACEASERFVRKECRADQMLFALQFLREQQNVHLLVNFMAQVEAREESYKKTYALQRRPGSHYIDPNLAPPPQEVTAHLPQPGRCKCGCKWVGDLKYCPECGEKAAA